MRSPLGYLWCSLFAVQIAVNASVAQEFLDYDELLSSWVETTKEVIDDFPDVPNITEFFFQLKHWVPDFEPYWAFHGGCNFDSYIYVLPGYFGDSAFSSFSVSVPYLFEVYRNPHGYPAGFVVNFDEASYDRSESAFVVSSNSFRSYHEFRYPPLWDCVRDALAIGQQGHLPISLAPMLHPSFTSWASETRHSVNGYQRIEGTDLFVRSRTVWWSAVVTNFYPLHRNDFSFSFATNYLPNFPRPSFRIYWRPAVVSSPVSAIPDYPGVFWFNNYNNCRDPDPPPYLFSMDCLDQLKAEFGDEYGIDFTTFFAMVAPCDSNFQARVDFDFSIEALVASKEEESP